jgi:transposase InsO family protein
MASGQEGPEVRRPAQAGLQRARAEREVVRGHDRDRDRRRQALASVLDLFSGKLLACRTSEHPNAELVSDAIKIGATSTA